MLKLYKKLTNSIQVQTFPNLWLKSVCMFVVVFLLIRFIIVLQMTESTVSSVFSYFGELRIVSARSKSYIILSL